MGSILLDGPEGIEPQRLFGGGGTDIKRIGSRLELQTDGSVVPPRGTGRRLLPHVSTWKATLRGT
jgi:hypothetical protein